MSNELKIINDENYQKWICEIKELVHVSQLKAAVQVNTEMIRMYWHIGKEISDKHADAIWGTGFYKRGISKCKWFFGDKLEVHETLF